MYPALLVVIGLTFLQEAVKGEPLNYDDERYIQGNELIADLDGASVGRMFSEYFDGHYHPVTLLSLALDRVFYQNPVKGHHTTNLLLHILNAILVFIFLYALFREYWLAFSVALLFMLHPMTVESYAWMTERKNVLYSSFFTLSALAYLRFLKQTVWWWLLACFLIFALAMLSKAQAMTFVAVMFLIDYLRERDMRSVQLYLEKLPFILVSVLFVILTTGAQAERWGVLDTTGYGPVDKLALSSYALLNYVVKGIIPFNLSAYYPYPNDLGEELSWYMYASIAGALLLLYLLWLSFRKGRKMIFFGLAFFLINIVLMLKYLDVPYGNYFMANRYNYLPLIGLLIIPVVYLRQASQKWEFNILLPIAVIAVTFGYLSQRRIEVWQNNVNLWSDVIEHYPQYRHAWNMRALGHIARGSNLKAVKNFERLLAMDPEFNEAYLNLGILYFRMDQPYQARKWLLKGLGFYPEDHRLYHTLAVVRSGMKQNPAALKDINQALSIEGEANPVYHLTRARILIQLDSLDEARVDLMAASSLPKARQLLQALDAGKIKTTGRTPAALLEKATKIAKEGRYREAKLILDEVLRMDPENKAAYINRGSTLGRLGNYGNALQDFQEALKLDPQDPRIYYLLGVTYRDREQRDLACENFQKAAQRGWQLETEIVDYCRY